MPVARRPRRVPDPGIGPGAQACVRAACGQWSAVHFGVAFERITVDPARMGGLPTIRETRVTVGMVLGQLAAGREIDDVLGDYPYLEREDVLAALEYAGGRNRA